MWRLVRGYNQEPACVNPVTSTLPHNILFDLVMEVECAAEGPMPIGIPGPSFRIILFSFPVTLEHGAVNYC
jgi:hypothetical protein